MVTGDYIFIVIDACYMRHNYTHTGVITFNKSALDLALKSSTVKWKEVSGSYSARAKVFSQA